MNNDERTIADIDRATEDRSEWIRRMIAESDKNQESLKKMGYVMFFTIWLFFMGMLILALLTPHA